MAAAPYVAIVGAGEKVAAELLAVAEEVGAELARRGTVVVTGGLGGVMEAACRGARRAGGTTLGILPGSDRAAANAFVDVAVATGMGELRNGLVVRCADALVAAGGEFGTLSEVAASVTAIPTGRPAWTPARAAEHGDERTVRERRADKLQTTPRERRREREREREQERDRDQRGGAAPDETTTTPAEEQTQPEPEPEPEAPPAPAPEETPPAETTRRPPVEEPAPAPPVEPPPVQTTPAAPVP